MAKKKHTPIASFLVIFGLLVFGFQEFGSPLSWFDFLKDATSNSPPPTKASKEAIKPKGSVQWPVPLTTSDPVQVSKDLGKKNFYLVFDGSGSMAEQKCSGKSTKEKVAKKAVIDFSKKIDKNDNIGLYIFDSKGESERVPMGTNNRSAIASAITASQAGGNTPLLKAIREGLKKLGQEASRQLGYGEYHLVVVTDGEASAGQSPSVVVGGALNDTPVVIHTVGFCIGKDHSLNQVGKTFYKSADNPASLSDGLEDVLAEAETFDVSDFEKIE